MIKSIRSLLLPILLFSFVLASQTQPVSGQNINGPRPYKLLSSGKQITIKSTQNIKNVMVWTTGGNRIVEHKDINSATCIVEIPLNQKTFFMMIAMNDGKIFTEKIGIRE